MCGRYRLTRVEKLAERFGIEPDDVWVPRYKIAPVTSRSAVLDILGERIQAPHQPSQSDTFLSIFP